MNLSISGTGIDVLGACTGRGTEVASDESSVDCMPPVRHHAAVLGMGLYARLRIARISGRRVNK